MSGLPHLGVLPALHGPPCWLRGPARIRDGHIELDPTQISVYIPHKEGVLGLPFALAGVRAEADAVAFAERFGLLRTSPDATVYRERFSEWKIATTSLRDALGLYSAVRAARAGDEPALERITTILIAREWAASAELRAQLDAHPGPLAKADITIAAILTSAIRDVRHTVEPAVLVEYPDENGAIRTGEPGHFFYSPTCATLAQLAFQVAAVTVSMQVAVRTCPLPECGRSFVPSHGRQIYCCTGHTNVAKQRRLRAPRNTAAETQKPVPEV